MDFLPLNLYFSWISLEKNYPIFLLRIAKSPAAQRWLGSCLPVGATPVDFCVCLSPSKMGIWPTEMVDLSHLSIKNGELTKKNMVI